MQKLIFLSLLSLLSSCSYISDWFAGEDAPPKIEKEKLALVFSGNINGETHPCGCRKFPMGGLPQVAGLFEEIKKERTLVYVDVGDTFFPSTFLPENLQDSLMFAARNLAVGLEKIGLHYYVPGDQDFAAGVEFLQEIAAKHKFQFLLSNLKEKKVFKHQPFVVLEKGEQKVFLLGLVNPDILPRAYRALFTPLKEGLTEALKVIEQEGYDKDNLNHRLVVFSHSGIDTDAELAEDFPQIQWIAGAHTQSFTQEPRIEGATKLIQNLSRNHYVAEMRFDLAKNRDADQFQMHEVLDHLKDKLSPNPFIEFIDNHKNTLAEIQREEQRGFLGEERANQKFETAQSCFECHQPQTEKWMETAHSAAYLTLMNANEPFNLSCIQCHALGTNDPRGFSRFDDMIAINPEKLVTDDKDETRKPVEELDATQEEKLLAQLKENYWTEVREAFSEVGSLRDLPPAEIRQISERWRDIDRVNGLTHNFANVQCLNCHDQHPDHPFHISQDPKPSPEELAQSMQNRCLTCHTTDQSPEWYNKDEKGLPTDVNQEFYASMVKKVACPSQSHEDHY